MASSINSSCQCLTGTSLRAARKIVRTRRPAARLYATTNNHNTSRSQEVEELSPSFNINDISSMAHVELETHRELRDLARRAAWEMPLLSKLSKPFQPPTSAQPLRWRFTTYLGELHPAAQKVVVEFCLRDLQSVSEQERQTMRKIAGPRWDPNTDIIKMSCESFETQAQNKRHLAETITALIKEAKEGADKFTDVPIDMRHSAARAKRRHKRTPGVKFPDEWRMTPERRAALDAKPGRVPQPVQPVQTQIEPPQATLTQEQTYEAIKQAALSQGASQTQSPEVAQGPTIVSGVDAIDRARQIDSRRVEEPIMAEARRPLLKGKMGKKEMGQAPPQRK
ncbi:hypothetical protein AMS68_005412 [Peltaster fructicola]|uniref:Small ribosomal subunit protein mS35 mitochondrial conserved domain-containing protein n=1 Tax=Peltaster fructicola TaxID=286661 RepID=A0A6H0XZ01_9PEZI|nr:hypothetical protein AMS68_005412 [Peltaster fructicola]